MEFFRRTTHFDFMGWRRPAAGLIVALFLASLVLLIPGVRGLNFGIDFTGGVLVELGYPTPADLPAIRSQLEQGEFGQVQVQNFGTATDVLVRVLPREEGSGAQVAEEILTLLRAEEPAVELRRTEFVGPQVGQELTERGALAILFALLMILAYIAFRFQWKFAVGAVVATLHDPIVVLGFFALTGIPFDLTVLAAILAVIGYSVNDTIVVFDRIRENLRKLRGKGTVEVMNIAINETLSRTLMTSGTTLLVVFAMMLFGGEVLRSFSTALAVGIVLGTFSSIFVASAISLWLGISAQDMLPSQKEQKEIDSMP